MAEPNIYSNPGIQSPRYSTTMPPSVQGKMMLQDRSIALEQMRQQMALGYLEAAKQKQAFQEYMYGAPSRYKQMDTELLQKMLGHSFAQQDFTEGTRPENMITRQNTMRGQQQFQLHQTLSQLDAAKQQRVLQASTVEAQLFGPAVSLWQQYKQTKDKSLLAQIDSVVRQGQSRLQSANMPPLPLKGSVEQYMPQLESIHQGAVMSLQVLQEIMKISAQGYNAANIAGIEGEYGLERQRIANQGALAAAKARAEDDESEFQQPAKVFGRTIALLNQGKLTPATPGYEQAIANARGHAQLEWLNKHRRTINDQAFIHNLMNPNQKVDANEFITRQMFSDLKMAYGVLYKDMTYPQFQREVRKALEDTPDIRGVADTPAPAGPTPLTTETYTNAQLQGQEPVEKGGKKWKIVGFDKDGSPLVEPWKDSSGTTPRPNTGYTR